MYGIIYELINCSKSKKASTQLSLKSTRPKYLFPLERTQLTMLALDHVVGLTVSRPSIFHDYPLSSSPELTVSLV